MLYLILRRIQDVSESAIDHLKVKLEKIKISQIPGENIDNVVSLIKSTHTALLSASTDDRNYVPDDFPGTILKIFQTTSVPKFNKAFEKEEDEARHKSDKLGGLPDWPTVAELTNLATNMYRRMQSSGKWHSSKNSKSSAFPSLVGANGGPPGSRSRGHQGSNGPVKRKCWNCNDENHVAPDCDKPKNESLFAKNKKAFFDHKKNSARSHPRSRPRTDSQGRPLTLNRQGVHVVDQRRYRRNKDLQALETEVRGLTVAPGTPDTSQDSPTPPNSTSNSASKSDPAETPPSANFARALQAQRDASQAKIASLIGGLRKW
jgi:hypothetical protein